MSHVNQESLDRANAFLAAFAARAEPGELVDLSPAELGREIEVPEPLAAARAVRALLARKRLEAVDGRYRVLDARPIEPGEREQVSRPRRSSARREPKEKAASGGRATYSAIGREVVERTIELGREVGTLRGQLRAAREEARDARESRDESERRLGQLAARVKELEGRAEMAEANLRTLLAAAKGPGRDAPVGDTEMEAILGVLKGEQEEAASRASAFPEDVREAGG
jgi:chromosome segregation ATPase